MLEEGIAGVREIDLGLMMGTGMIPGPFARADFRGLDDVLAALERAEQEWGEHFAPPLVLRRLVAQGRLGAKSGQGFYPYPRPGPGYETAPVKLDRRGDDIAVLWLDNPPANSLSPQVIEALEAAWRQVDGTARAVIIASPNPALFCAGPTSRPSRRWTRPAGADLLDRGARAAALVRAVADDDDRRGQRHGARRRLRAGDGLRRAARRLLRVVRPARDQPRHHPRLRRHPAAPAPRRPGQGAGDEHDGRPDRRRGGVRARAGQPRRGRSRAVRHGDGVGAQAPQQAPLALEQIKHVSHRASSTRASRPRRRASAASSPPRTRARASAPSSASGRRGSRASERTPARNGWPGCCARPPRRGAHRRRDLRPLGDPGLPVAGDRALGEREPDGGRAHRRLPPRPRAVLELLRHPLRRRSRASGPTARTPRSSSSSGAG